MYTRQKQSNQLSSYFAQNAHGSNTTDHAPADDGCRAGVNIDALLEGMSQHDQGVFVCVPPQNSLGCTVQLALTCWILKLLKNFVELVVGLRVLDALDIGCSVFDGELQNSALCFPF